MSEDVVRRDIERLQDSREKQGERLGAVESRVGVLENEVAGLLDVSRHYGERISSLQIGAEGVKLLVDQGRRTEEAVTLLAGKVEGRFEGIDQEIESLRSWRWWVMGIGVAAIVAIGAAWAIVQFVADHPALIP